MRTSSSRFLEYTSNPGAASSTVYGFNLESEKFRSTALLEDFCATFNPRTFKYLKYMFIIRKIFILQDAILALSWERENSEN